MVFALRVQGASQRIGQPPCSNKHPEARVRGVAATSLLFFSEARTSTFVILLSILLAECRKAHTTSAESSKRSVDKRNPWELNCLLARNRRPFSAAVTFSFFPSSLPPRCLFSVCRLPFSSVCFLLAASLPPIPPHSTLVWRFGSREWMFEEVG